MTVLRTYKGVARAREALAGAATTGAAGVAASARAGATAGAAAAARATGVARVGSALAALAVACAVALGCALPAAAWADVSEAALGVNVNVPSTAQHAPDGGSGGTGAAKGSEGALGVNLRVPDPVDAGENPDSDAKPGAEAGSGTSGAGAVLGVNLNLPSTALHAPVEDGPAGGSSATGSEAALGVNLRVPMPVDEDDNPDPDAKPGDAEGAGTSGSEAVLGVNLNVPSTVEQDASAGKGSEGVLGVNLSVQNGIVVSFDARNGRNTGASSVVANMKQPIERPSDPEWPGRVFKGWYTDANCTDGNEWRFADVGDGSGDGPDLVESSMTLYAKWETIEPRETGRVVLHMGYGNTVIDAAEAGSHGIAGADADALGISPGGYAPDPAGDEYAGAADPTYRGSYFLGGKGNEAPDLDGTLELPVPRMFPAESEDGDGRRSGVFVGWRTEPPVMEDGEPVYGGDVASRIGRFDTGAADEHGSNTQHFWAQWSLTATYDVTFHAEGGAWPGGSTDPVVVPVPERQTVAAPADPMQEGYAFKGWCTKDGSGALHPFDLRNPIEHDTDLYARWSAVETPPGQHTVTFDANGGAWENGLGTDDDETVRAVGNVADGATVDEPDPDPKRAGWQFAGWYLAAAGGEDTGDEAGAGDVGAGGDAASKVPLGGKWDFGKDTVSADTTLYAKWDLRLDVTVPVSVGFAVDADSLEVTTPDMGRYALKSRTVRDVVVGKVSVASEEEELSEFFEPADASEGWGPALGETTLSLRPDGADPEVRLALADGADAEDGESGRVWKSAYPLVDPDERVAFTMKAFSYEGISFDEGWRGADPSEGLPLKLDMTLSEKLRVKTALDGPRPITHLKLTVSARG